MKKWHPEQGDGEIFMGNQPCGADGKAMAPMQSGWNGTRMGRVAYGASGDRLQDLKPLFVSRSEIEAKIKVSNQEAAATLQEMLDAGTATIFPGGK